MSLPPIVVTGLMALAFSATHVLIGQLRFVDRQPRSRWLSFAGGVAVGYVFLHLLPELAAHGRSFSSELGLEELLAESLVYALALTGLVVFYGTERAMKMSRGRRQAEEGRDRPERGIFWLHIAASSVLIFIIGYLLNHREDMSIDGLALFFIAMLLHFVTADFGSRHDHPELYDRQARWVLVAATMGGWLFGLVVEIPTVAIGGLFAFVGGAIILVVLKEELPEERQSYFLPFLGGAAAYALLVFAASMR